MPAPFSRRAAVAIVLLALAVRLAAGAWWQSRLPEGTRFFFGDSESYWALGQRLARGESYQFQSSDERVFRAPGYPLILSVLFRLLGTDAPVFWGRALSALLGAAAVALVIGWAGWLFDARTGRVAGLLAALYPGQIGLGALVLSEAAVCPLIIARALAVGSCQPQRRPSGALALVGGCRHRGRSGHIGAAQLAALYAVCRAHGDRILTPQAGTVCRRLVMLALLAAVLAPWWIRNARIIGHFVPTTLQVGASLYDGLNPTATGASDMRFAPEFKARLLAADQEDVRRAKIRWSIGSIGCWPPRPSAGPKRIRCACWSWPASSWCDCGTSGRTKTSSAAGRCGWQCW